MCSEKQLIQEIVGCDDYRKALENLDHPCWKTVRNSIFQGKQLTPEAWRFSDGCRSLDEVESLLLGWNPAIGANTHAPSYYERARNSVFLLF